MLLAALFPPGTPTWMRLALEAATLLVGARLLLGAIRRLNAGILVLAAAGWAWFLYPPGHAWMAVEAGRLLVEVRGTLADALDRSWSFVRGKGGPA
jgi:hypothetical protein